MKAIKNLFLGCDFPNWLMFLLLAFLIVSAVYGDKEIARIQIQARAGINTNQ